MPFSVINTIIKKIKITNPYIVTLQVRIPRTINHGKKAFPSISGSMTLEAALCLPLFIFASVSLILPMKILTTERRVQAGLEAVGEDFSRYAYLQDALLTGKNVLIPGADEFSKEFSKNLTAGTALGYAHMMALEHADTKNVYKASVLRSEILEDGENVNLILDYEIKMPFPVLGLQSIKRTAHCVRRAWIGKEGWDEAEGVSEKDEDDEIVYVGKNSTRYHRDRNCHYLANSMTAVSYEQISGYRNDSGEKYHACAVCSRSAGADGIVYIMPSGSSYHTREDCTAIIAYVRAVRLAEVRYLGACSYCSR